ncbi:hypothetical protein C7I85_22975 [Mesorhizobium soli]|uniref:Autotransporter domain-containing protein n=2 Tax=Pseudaminobacter soli (ex Li et al. 2025) TaxID=1295366 RepID=A0A2P7S3N9_9HYPH|nr:hypothetical protein C7I85_22975 [Mesorhizobium soli]
MRLGLLVGGLLFGMAAAANAACDATATSGFFGTVTFTSVGDTIRLCVTDKAVQWGLYGVQGANTLSLPMSGQSMVVTDSYLAQTSKAAYTITPIPNDGPVLEGFPEYDIKLLSMPSASASDTIQLWYSLGCSVGNGCNGSPANTAFTITVNLPVPTVTSISPTSGPATGGTVVTITGTNFTGATAVKFGATNATSYTVNSSTQITATAPAGSVGTVDVTVTTAGGTSATSAWDRFSYLVAPVVTSISPQAGPAEGGTSVIITGTNFTSATTVKFGTTNAAGYAFNSSTQITATAPAGTGTIDVTVTTAGGTSATSAADQFTYIANPTATTAIAATSLTQGRAVTAFMPVTGSGGIAPLSYSVAPSLPAGLSMGGTGVITGTPTVAQTASSFTVTVTDANSATATANFSLTVNPAVTAAQAIASVTLTQNKAVSSFAPVIGGGGTAALAYSISPSLPAGLSLDTGNGTVSGTPTAASVAAAYTVTVTDTNGATASNTFSLAVNPAVRATQAIASVALTQNKAATSFTPVTGGGGTAPLSYSVSPSLPTGLSFDTVNGTVSGTPSAASDAAIYTVTATDTNSATATATFSLTVNAAVTATQSVSSATLTANHTTSAFTPVTGSGGTGALSYVVSPSLPAGLSFNVSNGTVSGRPIASVGASVFTVTISDTNGASATATFNLAVNGPLAATQTMASTMLTADHAATPFTPVTGGGGTAPLSYSVSPSLPAGMSFDAVSGVVSGVPSGASVAAIHTVTVTDANSATATATFSLTVNAAVTVTTMVSATTLTANHAATAFTPVKGSGGTGILSYTVSPSLPAGLSFDTSTGQVTGTPTVTLTGTTFTVTVTDGNGATASTSFALVVNGALSATQSVASTTLTADHAAAAFTPVTGGGGTGTLSYGIAPSLPAGLSFNASTGEVSGLPTATLPATDFTVTVTDINDATASATFSLTVNGAVTATQTASSTTLTLGHAATAFTPVTGSGGRGPLTYNISPSLPAGLSFSTSTGQITGVPTATLTETTFTVTIIDVNNASASNSFMLTVDLPTLTFMPASLPNAIVGNTYSQMIVAAEGTAPYSYAVTGGALPDGLSFDGSTGKLSGTPNGAGSSNFTITATDANSATGSITYSLTVSGPGITVVSTTGTVVTGTSATVDLTQGATGGPFTGARLISLSPSSAGTATITLGDTAAVSEMVVAEIVEAGHYKLKFTAAPDFTGTAVATFTLSNSYGSSPAGTVTFIVTPRKDPSKDADVTGLVNAQTEAAKRFAATQMSNFNDHLEQLHGGDCLQNQWGLAISDSRHASQDRQDDTAGQISAVASENPQARKGKAKSDQTARAGDSSSDRCSPFGDGAAAVWTGGFVNFGSMDFGASGQKFDYTTVGVSAGIDYRFSQSFTAGIGFGYGSDRGRIGDSGTQTDASAYSVALYGSYHPTPQIFVDGLVGYGELNFDSRRFATDVESFAYGSRDGHQYFGSLTAGYEYINDGLLISPYGRFTASRSVLDPFTENGAGWADLRYGSQSIDTFTGFLGLRLAYKIDTDWGSLEPHARVEYGHDFAGNSAVTLGYADIPSTSYDLKTLGTGSDFATFSLGTDIKVGPDLTVGAEYGTSVGQNGMQPHQIRLRISERF